jgi:hypothetical protein
MLRALTLAALLAAGCDDLTDYATVPGESKYAGCVVGTGATTFIRSEVFREGAAMELQFDPDSVTQISDRNTITVINPAGEGGVPAEERLFDGTQLRPIAKLSHDVLSDFDFPGSGRIRNFILMASGSGALLDREAMVFVSVMESDRVEVRVIAGRTTMDGEENFGLFRLNRTEAAASADCTP